MRLLAFIFVFLVAGSGAMAQRNTLKPQDFKPLTELPWQKEGATLPQVLRVIYLEPNEEMRAFVLEEYLHQIPLLELEAAFDQCVVLEGDQTPDNLVHSLLRIWAARDPEVCWQKTRGLFRLIGIERDWLDFDSWGNRRIKVRDWDAIKASRYWLRRDALLGFLKGLEKSELTPEARKSMKSDFALAWFRAFDAWPVDSATESDSALRKRIVRAFLTVKRDLPALVNQQKWVADVPVFEVAVRRWLAAEPAKGLEIINLVVGKNWFADATVSREAPQGPSLELLMLWADLDLTAMTRWSDNLDMAKDPAARDARAMIMGRVDATIRDRWLAQAKVADQSGGALSGLLCTWAAWDPLPAMEAVLDTKDDEMIEEAIVDVAFGPWSVQPWNTCHFGLGAVKSFDLARLPKGVINNEWAGYVQECWGEIDIGECARFGVEYMVKHGFVSRENLVKLFSGDDAFGSDGDVIDRTFCALRVWAVVKPDEMRAWIPTQKDAEMRTALTWLLEHPWGTRLEK